MALQTIPVWTIPPNWISPVAEGIEWLTSVFTSTLGVEQRQQLRLSPRRYIDYTANVSGGARRYFDNLLSVALQNMMYVPMWFDIAYLRTGVSAGATSILVRGAPQELLLATALFLPGPLPYIYDLVEVTSVAAVGEDTQFNLGAALTRNWAAGSTVFRAIICTISAPPSYTRLSDDALQAAIRFDSHEPNDWPGTVGFPTYGGFPVVTLDENLNDQQSGSYFRHSATIDNKVGLIDRADIAGINFPTFARAGMVQGRASSDTLRSIVYALKGRFTAAWFVFPTSDFQLVALRVGASDTAIKVERAGYTEFGGPTIGRDHICFRLRNGTNLYRRIVASAISGANDELETLGLDSALGVVLLPKDIISISFMALGRLDQDLVELSHLTDLEGVCTANFAIRGVPDYTTKKDIFIRLNNGPWNDNADADPDSDFGGINAEGISAGGLFPLAGMNTGFAGLGTVIANFGRTPFSFAQPSRSRNWDAGNTTTWSPTDNAGVGLSSDKLTLSVGAEATGKFGRATTSSDTQLGLRYFEITVGLYPQNLFIGMASPTFNVSQPLFGPNPAGSMWLMDTGFLFINGGQTSIFLGRPIPGDVICFAVYTGYQV